MLETILTASVTPMKLDRTNSSYVIVTSLKKEKLILWAKPIIRSSAGTIRTTKTNPVKNTCPNLKNYQPSETSPSLLHWTSLET